MSTIPKPLVVVIEDDRSLATLIAEQLFVAGFATHVFHKGSTALKFIEKNFVNLVLLDPDLPDIDGFFVLEQIPKYSHAPGVIFISSLRDVSFIVKSLDAGADDFIAKPYHPHELIARIRSVLRRSELTGDIRLTRNTALNTKVFLFNKVEVHADRLELVFESGETEKIGRKALGILFHFYSNPSVIISRQSLIHAVWGLHADLQSHSLDQYLVKIRAIFAYHQCQLDCLRTIHGIGYWYEPPK